MLIKGFRNFKSFVMQGNVVVAAVGLVIALALSTLIKAFTDNVITPLVNAAAGKGVHSGVGWTVNGQRVDLGAVISAFIYFVVFMAVVYFAIVVPYRAVHAPARQPGVLGPPADQVLPGVLLVRAAPGGDPLHVLHGGAPAGSAGGDGTSSSCVDALSARHGARARHGASVDEIWARLLRDARGMVLPPWRELDVVRRAARLETCSGGPLSQVRPCSRPC